MLNAVFIDRDGTINVEKDHLYKISDFEYIQGVLEALKCLTDNKVEIYIVTNQAGIAKGLFTELDFKQLTTFMLNSMQSYGIKIADVLYCPHHPKGTVAAYQKTCQCRKPQSGLLLEVIKQHCYNYNHLALIGDKNSDIEAARKLGIKTYLVETGYGMSEKANTKADYVVKDLSAAVHHLLSIDK